MFIQSTIIAAVLFAGVAIYARSKSDGQMSPSERDEKIQALASEILETQKALKNTLQEMSELQSQRIGLVNQAIVSSKFNREQNEKNKEKRSKTAQSIEAALSTKAKKVEVLSKKADELRGQFEALKNKSI